MKDHQKIIFYLFLFSFFLIFPCTSQRMEMEKLGGGSWLCVGGRSEVDFACGDSEMFKSVCLCMSHRHLDKHVCSFSRAQAGDIQITLDVDLGTARGSDLGEVES